MRDLGPAPERQRAPRTISVAVGSGGFTINNNNDIARGYVHIDLSLASYYLIGSRSATRSARSSTTRGEDQPARRRRWSAREGYYAPSDEPAKPLRRTTLDPDNPTALTPPSTRLDPAAPRLLRPAAADAGRRCTSPRT